MKTKVRRPKVERDRAAVDAWDAWQRTQQVTLPQETAMMVMRAFAAGFDAGWWEHAEATRNPLSEKPRVPWQPGGGTPHRQASETFPPPNAGRIAGRCEVCGASTADDWGRCTNGRCAQCHAKWCGPGGNTTPGHARLWPGGGAR